MDKSTHEEHLYQPLQTNNKQFKIAVIFLTGYNGIFKLTNSNIRFSFMKSITDEAGYIKITITPAAYENEYSNNEIKRIIIDKGHHSEDEHPFMIKPNFSTLGSIIKISPQGTIISFIIVDIIRDLLGFNARTSNKEYNLSPNPVDILSFDNIFTECNIARGMNFKGKPSIIIHNFTKDVSPGY